MAPGRDVCWILSGKVRTNEDIITKVVRAMKWGMKEFYLHYSSKMMAEMGYFQRMRGLANSGTAEKLYLCWKGQAPKDWKKQRMYIDVGSHTYIDSLLNVPIGLPKEMGLVPRAVFEAWDKQETSEGAGSAEQSTEGAGADPAAPDLTELAEGDSKNEANIIKKRKYSRRGSALAKMLSTDEVLLFPHDISGALMKELIYESSAEWVLNGSPALGSSVYACLEMQVPVVNIVKSDVHKTHLLRCLKERLATDLPLTGSNLACCDLVSRADLLRGAKPSSKKKAQKVTHDDDDLGEPEEDDEDDDNDEDDASGTGSAPGKDDKGKGKDKSKKKDKKEKKDKKKNKDKKKK